VLQTQGWPESLRFGGLSESNLGSPHFFVAVSLGRRRRNWKKADDRRDVRLCLFEGKTDEKHPFNHSMSCLGSILKKQNQLYASQKTKNNQVLPF